MVNSAHVPVKEMSVSILQIFIQNFVRKHFEIAEISSYLGENFLTPSMRFVKCRQTIMPNFCGPFRDTETLLMMNTFK